MWYLFLFLVSVTSRYGVVLQWLSVLQSIIHSSWQGQNEKWPCQILQAQVPDLSINFNYSAPTHDISNYSRLTNPYCDVMYSIWWILGLPLFDFKPYECEAPLDQILSHVFSVKIVFLETSNHIKHTGGPKIKENHRNLFILIRAPIIEAWEHS